MLEGAELVAGGATCVCAAWTTFWCERSRARIVLSDERHEDHMATARRELARERTDG